MTAQGKAAGALVTPSTAHKNQDCTDHSTGAGVPPYDDQRDFLARNERVLAPIEGLRRSCITTRGALVEAALKVRGYEVERDGDGSYSAVHQYRTEHLPDFPALEAFARSLGAKLHADGGAA